MSNIGWVSSASETDPCCCEEERCHGLPETLDVVVASLAPISCFEAILTGGTSSITLYFSVTYPVLNGSYTATYNGGNYWFAPITTVTPISYSDDTCSDDPSASYETVIGVLIFCHPDHPPETALSASIVFSVNYSDGSGSYSGSVALFQGAAGALDEVMPNLLVGGDPNVGSENGTVTISLP